MANFLGCTRLCCTVLSFIMSFIMFYPEMFVDYPLVNCDIAIEHGPIEIVDLPIKNGDFPSFFVCLPGRVFHPKRTWKWRILHRLWGDFLNKIAPTRGHVAGFFLHDNMPGGFHKWGYPIAGWLIMDNLSMDDDWGYPHDLGNPHLRTRFRLLSLQKF